MQGDSLAKRLRNSSKGRAARKFVLGSPAEATSPGASDAAVGWAALAIGLFNTGFLLWKNHKPPGMPFYEYNLVNLTFVFFLPLVFTLLFLRRDAADLGMTVGDARRGTLTALGLFALFIPVLVFTAPMADVQRYYPRWFMSSGLLQGAYFNGTRYEGGAINWERLIAHQAVMAFYMFGWEWYHRGFLLTGMKRLLPTWGAVVAQALFFMILHWAKPWPEFLSSLPGGILMGAVALHFRSFLPCFLLHFLVSAGFDAAVLYYYFR